MTDALFKMEGAPRDGTPVLLYWKDTQTGCIGKWDRGRRLWGAHPHTSGAFDEYFDGWLPVQHQYPVSAAVAKTAGEWLSVCSDEDAADVGRALLGREGVRWLLAKDKDSEFRSRQKAECMELIAQKGQDDG